MIYQCQICQGECDTSKKSRPCGFQNEKCVEPIGYADTNGNCKCCRYNILDEDFICRDERCKHYTPESAGKEYACLNCGRQELHYQGDNRFKCGNCLNEYSTFDLNMPDMGEI